VGIRLSGSLTTQTQAPRGESLVTFFSSCAMVVNRVSVSPQRVYVVVLGGVTKEIGGIRKCQEMN
jgi:hypothetical protein